MNKTPDLKTKCIDSLRVISGSVTAKDKSDAAKKFNIHKNTVLGYLRGEVGDIDMGLQLIDFFNQRISKKIDKVHKILSA